MRAMTADVESYKLAEHFLSDTMTAGTSRYKDKAMSLARAIQSAVEDWQADEAEDERAREEAHRTDEGDLGHLTILGACRR